MQRVIIVHGYEGNPNVHWLPWLRAELEKLGVEVLVPAMPNTNEPKLSEWLPHLQTVVGSSDEQTYFVGYSLGCPTVLRFLEALPDGQKVGGAVLVAPFAEPIRLTELNSFVEPTWDDTKITQATDNITLISSDNDPYIPFDMAERMRDRFQAKLITLHNAGHINTSSGYTDAPEVLTELKMMLAE